MITSEEAQKALYELFFGEPGPDPLVTNAAACRVAQALGVFTQAEFIVALEELKGSITEFQLWQLTQAGYVDLKVEDGKLTFRMRKTKLPDLPAAAYESFLRTGGRPPRKKRER